MSAELVQATLRVAVAKLRSAADVGTVRSALMDAIAALAPDGGTSSTGSDAVCTPLCEGVFSRFLDTLLARVLPKLGPVHVNQSTRGLLRRLVRRDDNTTALRAAGAGASSRR